MEAEKSHDLSSASWRPRIAGAVIPVPDRWLENQRSFNQFKGRRN